MKHKQVTDLILKSFFEVYNNLGIGFNEKLFENAMIIELEKNGLKIENQIPINIQYYSKSVGNYVADILVNNTVLVELKAIRKLTSQDECQLLNYLNATEFEVGLLLNFGDEPEIKRKVYDNQFKRYFQKKSKLEQLKSNDLIEKIIYSFYQVYDYFGYGFKEKVYRNALAIEFQKLNLTIKRDFPLSIKYNQKLIGEYLTEFYIEDILIKVISKKNIEINDEKKIVNYLKGTKVKSGLILNFGPKSEIKRKYLNKKTCID